MSPWLSRVADYNPVTYILAAERSLISEGWNLVAPAGRHHLRPGRWRTQPRPGPLAALKGRATRK